MTMIKNSKRPLGQRISEMLDMPLGTFGKVSSVEATGKREVTVCGCEGLLTYTDTKAVLRLCDGVVSVCGEGLELRSFAGGRVMVRGSIGSIIYGECGGAGDDI